MRGRVAEAVGGVAGVVRIEEKERYLSCSNSSIGSGSSTSSSSSSSADVSGSSSVGSM